MKIEKAIEILRGMRDINLNYYFSDRKDALELGIEALKRVKGARTNLYQRYSHFLPGETKE